jgi:hypothetical protein
MEINEKVATAAFSTDEMECPLAPHAKQGFSSKAIRVKSVSELRKAMVAGESTRLWEQIDTTPGAEKFRKKKNTDGRKDPNPQVSGGCISVASVKYPLSVAAHHLIPGEASLPVSTVAKYIWESEGTIEFDIGYDVDGSENGAWLPTHQSMSGKMGSRQTLVVHDEEDPAPTRGMSWAELSERAREREGSAAAYSEYFLPSYTQQAMRLIGGQFHDAHETYSNWVVDKLNDIATRIDTKIENCPKCKNANGKKSPPYLLVFRLNALSATMRSLVMGRPRRSWLSVYTSEFARMYFRSPLPHHQVDDILDRLAQQG